MMMKFIFLRKLKQLLGGDTPSTPLENIYTQKEFLVVLNRARAQADRNGHCFALATFDVTAKEVQSISLKSIAKLLSTRIRATDAVGWFDESQLGVYLYDSNAKDAQGFCQEVHKQLGCDISSRVYVYPYYYKQNLPADEGSSGKRQAIGVGLERYEKVQYALFGSGAPFEDQTRWFCSSECDVADDYSQGLEPIFGRRHPYWKRAFDLCVATAILLVCSPIIIALALYIKIVSPGPVLFKQERVGYLGRRFTCWKFRSMHVNNDARKHRAYLHDLINNGRAMTKMEDDPRIIPFGKYIRASGIDELPQLLNVLRGEMSLIGPRPPIPYEVERYHRWFHGRFDTKPGLTGLWQVSGKNRLSFQEMIRLDIRYNKRLSLLRDIIILLRTPTAVWQQIFGFLPVPQKSTSAKMLKQGIKSNA
jgi:lipopolysaccharide/colanic/teichoic acid biosynthesis glycosyltransferase/GGDEF domain-containing protein